MKFGNIYLGSDVEIDSSSSINHVTIKNGAKIAKSCSIYGGPDNQLEIGENVYIGMHSIINGFRAKLVIGDNVSISQGVNIMVDSGPNASPAMMHIYPIEIGPVNIGHDCWIGTGSIIMPNVTLGEFCVVGANSFVNSSFNAFSIVGGNPARLIRVFNDEEKLRMLDVSHKYSHTEISHYENHYKDLPFEGTLRIYRKRRILEALEKYHHKCILEIGCGPDPLFNDISDFEKMVVVEPGKLFYTMAESAANKNSNIVVINDLIENLADELKNEKFDFVVIGGFLHEIHNPEIVLKSVRKICQKNTVVFSFVPNATSFHRLLGEKMSATESIYHKSEHDELFNRQNVYDLKTFNKLFTDNNFKVLDSGSYFIKPFTHRQMDMLMNSNILEPSFLDGLEKMINYMPENGAELFNICNIDD